MERYTEHRYLKNIKKGMKVQILNSQQIESTGIIEEIASRTPFHEAGIMVRLKNGDVGRVKKIILAEPGQNEKLAAEIKKLMDKGENFHTEFKAEALWSTTYNHEQLKTAKSFELREYGQKASKLIIAKSIASFLNSDGGNLIIGIKEKKEEGKFEILGISEDLKKLKEQNKDEYRRLLIDEILRAFLPPKIYNHLNNYIDMQFVELGDKTVLWLKIKKSDSRVFLNINGKEVFMIRVDSENRTLDGEKLVDYCIKQWGNR